MITTQSYVIEMMEFVKAVLQGKPTPVSGNDDRIPVVIGLAAKKSLAENRPVKLSEIA